MTRKKPITKIIASVLSVMMVFGVLMFVSPTEAQAISLNATDTGFYNLAYGANGDTTFGAGTQIRVINHTRTGKNKSEAVYKFDGVLDWEPVDPNKYIVWQGITDNTFYGVYPYNAKYDSFTIPTDQSGGVQDADWMTDDFTANKSIGKVEFAFQHRLAKVTVNITKWNSEFEGTEEITEPKIYTKGIEVEATYGNGAAISTKDNIITGIDPYVDGTSYTAIVAPVKYDANDKFMTFTVNGQEMTILAKNGTLTGGLQPGNHYTFDLTVGKDAVEITEVTVNGWKEETINAGTAEECIPPIVNLNGNTANIIMPEKTLAVYVTEAVAKAISDGATAIVVSGAVDDECYAAVIEERSEAMVFFKDLEENNYVASNGTTYTCVIGSESAEKYVLISTSPRMDYISNNGNIATIANQLLPAMVPGSRVILSTEEAWSVYKPMVETCLDAQTYPWPLGNDRQCYAFDGGKWYLSTIHGGLSARTYGWFPVFDVPLS